MWPRTSDSARGIVASAAIPAETLTPSDDSTDEEKRPATGQVVAEQTDVIALVGQGYPSRQQRWSLLPSLNRSYNPLTQLKNICITMTFAPVLLTNLWYVDRLY